MSVAGSDPCGGAGIQADIRACQCMGAMCATVVTALTVQDTRMVRGVYAVPPGVVEMQMRAVVEDLRPGAVKVGMLPDVHTVAVVSGLLSEYACAHVVCDPVLSSSSGAVLGVSRDRTILLEQLFPLCELITPNVDEATALTGIRIKNTDDMVRAGEWLISNCGCTWVLVKGGHITEMDKHPDVLVGPNGFEDLTYNFHIDTKNTHGTGCSLSSAIAALLTGAESVHGSVEQAIDWLHERMWQGRGWVYGHGHGPANFGFI